MRASATAAALQSLGDVTVLVVGSEALNTVARDASEKEFTCLDPVPVTPSRRSATQRLRRWLDLRFLDVHGVTASKDARNRAQALLQDFDLVWVVNSRTPNILQIWDWSGSHLDIDDVPSTYTRTIAASSPHFAQRLKARLQQRLLIRREYALAQRFSTLSVCSVEDKLYLGGDDTTHVIPNGVNRPLSHQPRNLDPLRPRLGFIGLYSYPPNHEGVQWFLERCWSSIRDQVPGARLRLIGKDTDGHLRPDAPGCDALGWVADPGAEISTWSAMIVPIRSGGGTRVKLADAFSRRCPAVSTSVGAFGYSVVHNEHLAIADRGEDFAFHCVKLLKEPAWGTLLAESAWDLFERNWTWDAIAPKFIFAANDCLRRKSSLDRIGACIQPR